MKKGKLAGHPWRRLISHANRFDENCLVYKYENHSRTNASISHSHLMQSLRICILSSIPVVVDLYDTTPASAEIHV